VKYIKYLFLILLFPSFGWTATIPAASCSRTDVAAAIALSTHGDTVTIPAGDCTGVNAWTTYLTVTKGITIQGSNTPTDTTITKIAGQVGVATHIFSMNVAAPNTWKITGITFSGGKGGDSANGLILVQGTAINWRITENKFTNFGAFSVPSISIRTKLGYGLIDKNVIACLSTPAGNITIDNTDSTDDGNGTYQWDIPYVFGLGNVTYIENNIFDGTGLNKNSQDAYFWIIDGQYGGKVVVRYNTAINYNLSWHGSDTSTRGFIGGEIYNNSFTNDKNSGYSIGRVMSHRSGTALIYNNVASGRWTAFSRPYNYRTKTGGIGDLVGQDWGYCDGRPFMFCSGSHGRKCATNAECAAIGAGSCSVKVCSGDRDKVCTSDASCTGFGTCSAYLDQTTVISGDGMTGVASCNSCSTTVLEVAGTPFTASALVNDVVWNTTNNTWCKISANTTSTITCVADLKTDLRVVGAAWQTGDGYKIADGYPCRDQPGIGPGGQVSQPFYGWNNSYCSTSPTCTPVTDAGVMLGAYTTVADRDYFNASSMADAKSKTPGLQADYAPYTCPHPLADPTAAKTCDSTISGTLGYGQEDLGDVTPPVYTDASILSQVATSSPFSVTLTGSTDELAQCKFSTTNQAYAAMEYQTFPVDFSNNHVGSALQYVGAVPYYVRCIDQVGNPATSSVTVTITATATAPFVSVGSGPVANPGVGPVVYP
jgi:hypothetical protein